MYPCGFEPPAPPPSAAVMVLISFTPAKMVTAVEFVSANGISCSMKLPSMIRPYCWPRD
jgi:hypothetical protein